MFIDERLPPRIAAGFKGGPEFHTRVVTLRNGLERRNKDWVYSRYRYVANFGAFNPVDRQALLSIFQATGGRWAAFRFKDPTDWLATDAPLVPEVGTSDPAQLLRAYTFGTQTQIRNVQAPLGSTVTIKKDGAPFTAYTLDADTGLVTPDAAWGAGTYTWSGQFDLWVRFDSDWAAFTATARDVWTANMELVEVFR